MPHPIPARCQTAVLAIALAATALAAGEDDGGPAPQGLLPALTAQPVPGFVAPRPGEHPRLFFRKGDVATLRQRAETAEGTAIIARLKICLGGGEAMPTSYSPMRNGLGDAPELPLGTYTLWHGAGFGLLYQLTGERRYADLGRQCVDKAMIDGVRDIDPRNAFIKPTSSIRGGPSIAAIAVAYDLCHDGWDEDYRRKVCAAIVAWRQPGEKGSGSDYSSLERVTTKPKLGPHSNHFGMNVGGGVIACLAVHGDAGGDDARTGAWLAEGERNLARAVTEGFGDGGYFHEHPGPGTIAAGQVLVPAYQALKVAGGKDLIATPNVRWLTMKWAMEVLPAGGKVIYPNGFPNGGYGTEHFDRGGNSHGGQFAQGFGAVLPGDLPALLWVYRTFVEPGECGEYPRLLKPGERSFDVLLYPQRAIFALVNWPIGVAARNPAEVIPRVAVDSLHGHYVFRNRWQDADDILVAVTLRARGDRGQRVMVWGLQERLALPAMQGATASFRAAEDGSGVLSDGKAVLGVDYSRASGAEALIVMTGAGAIPAKGGKAKATTVVAGGTTFQVLTLSSGAHPEARAEGATLVVGGQKVSASAGTLEFATMAGPPKLKM